MKYVSSNAAGTPRAMMPGRCVRLLDGAALLRAAVCIWAACAQTAVGADDVDAAATTVAAQSEQSYIRWADNSVSLLPYGWGYEVDPEEQSTVSFEHVHESAIGDLFMFLDATHFHDTSGGDEATWYGQFAPRLSLGKIFDTDLSWTPLRPSLFEAKDILLATKYERGEDPDVAEAVLVGIGLDLDVREAGILGPQGKFNFIQMNLYARKELITGVDKGFEDMQLSMAAAYPFTIGCAKFLVDGYFDWVFGLGSEEWSYHINPQLKLDVGSFWDRPGRLYTGVEVDLWWNKYQIPDTSAFDTDQTAVSLLLKYHL